MTWETGASLVEYGLRRANELGVSVTGEGDFEKDYRDYINLAYWDIVGEFPWLWARKYPPYSFTTNAPVHTSGTVTTPNSIELTPTAFVSSMVGWKLVFESDGIVTRIATQSGSIVTCTAPYPHETSGNVVVYTDEYVVPSDLMIPLRLLNLRTGGELEPLPQDLFLAQFGTNTPGGSPTCYTHISGDRIQLGRWPEERDVYELWYTYTPPALDFSNSLATDTPILPMRIRWTIADRALFYLLTDMDDSKAALAVANSSERLKEEKNRDSVKMSPQWWIPRRYRLARGRF